MPVPAEAISLEKSSRAFFCLWWTAIQITASLQPCRENSTVQTVKYIFLMIILSCGVIITKMLSKPLITCPQITLPSYCLQEYSKINIGVNIQKELWLKERMKKWREMKKNKKGWKQV